MQKILWPRIIAEATAIVASILLAFAIDAWWQRQNEADLADTLKAGLRDDFEASQAHIAQWLSGNQRMFRALTAFRDRLAATPTDGEISVPIEWVMAAVGAPTYSPTESTLQTAISSGQIELIGDIDLRDQLAKWQQQLDDTREDELLIRQIVVHQLVPEIAAQTRLARAFEFDLIVPWFVGDITLDPDEKLELRATTRLEGVIAERLFYTTFVVGGLGDIQETQAQILRLLEEE